MARGEPLIRQWNLLKALQAHRFGISAEELAERLECDKRTVQRDMKVLREVGFPVEHEVRDFGKRFWKLSGRFIESDELMLSITEMLSLFLCQQLLSPLSGTQFGDGLVTALDKIKALLPKKALKYFEGLEESLFVKQVAHHDYSIQDKEIAIINDAISSNRVLKIRYQSVSKSEPYDALFHPYGLVLYGVNLYCVGFLEKYGEVRTLKVSRLLGVELTDKTFRRPAEFALDSHLQGAFGIIASGKPQTVVVRFTNWAATNVREHQWHPTQQIIENEKDHCVARFELSNTTEFRRWILGFGRDAVVMEPKELAKNILVELQSTREAYGVD